MLRDEDCKALADECGAEEWWVSGNEDTDEFYAVLRQIARSAYELGRQHQREADAELCVALANSALDFERPNAYQCAKAIRNNTGDPKCQNPK